NFMGYRELRVWGRGRGRGWGAGGDLQMYVKVGRDARNFYLYRTAVGSGPGASAWLPEVHIEFDRFYQLRSALQRQVQSGAQASVACTGADSLIVARSGLLPAGSRGRFAACNSGYIVYSEDPLAAAPNLAAVQEL